MSAPTIKILRKRFSRGFRISAQRHGKKYWVVFHDPKAKTPRHNSDKTHWVECEDEDDCLSYFRALINQQD